MNKRLKRKLGPPEGEPWVWHPLYLLASMAWRHRSINLVRLLDFLEIEHMRHAGQENGNLVALYDDLVKFGIGRRFLSKTISEGEEKRLIVVDHGLCMANGKRAPSRFRLTYLPTKEEPATDEWKRYREPLNQPSKIHFEPAKGEPVPVHEGELGSKGKVKENRQKPSSRR
jgi:hypothetical protein